MNLKALWLATFSVLPSIPFVMVYSEQILGYEII